MAKLIKCQDHLGNTYRSIRAMCRHYNIETSTFRHRIKKGCSLENALLSEPLNAKERKTLAVLAQSKPSYDHKHNYFKNLKVMCEYYGVNYSSFKNRRNVLGWKLEKALTYKADLTVKDHLGNEYSNLTEMCKHYNIRPETFRSRYYYSQWNLEDSLLKPVGRDFHVYDHLGKRFKNTRVMCKNWKIRLAVYSNRIKKGWTVERALTEPVGVAKVKCEDHLGRKYKSIKEMCRKYKMPNDTYRHRIKNGWSLERALTTPVHECKRRTKK